MLGIKYAIVQKSKIMCVYNTHMFLKTEAL